MEQRKAKVLVVDDSSFLRKLMVRLMAENPAIEVVGEARNGKEALELTEKLRPDVITLDINMPVMDGLTALKEIMNSFPTPVIMVSSLTTEDAQITFEALEKGAVEFFPKQTADFNANIKSIKDELVPKILTIVLSGEALFGDRPAAFFSFFAIFLVLEFSPILILSLINRFRQKRP